jgi:hypothetical protein
LPPGLEFVTSNAFGKTTVKADGGNGIARVRLASGRIRLAELHWYEAHGIGKRELKRKRYLD